MMTCKNHSGPCTTPVACKAVESIPLHAPIPTPHGNLYHTFKDPADRKPISSPHYYIVQARDWDEALQKKFGENGEGLHLLSDEEVIALIMEHGRAEIRQESGARRLDFQNTYD